MAGIDMGVQIDQAWRHDLAAAIAYAAPLQAVANGGNLAIGEGDIGHTVDILGGIDNATAFQDQVMHLGFSLLA